MSTSNTGGQAFPQSWHDSHGTYWEHGMTLRDYFAAKAVTALLATNYYQGEADVKGASEYADDLARESYEIADAMLKARQA